MTNEASKPADDAAWVDIKRRYEEGREPIKDIAATAGLPPVRLSMQAKALGWLLRTRNKTATKQESTNATLRRLKDLLQKRIGLLEVEINSINEEVSELKTERGIRAMNTLVRTVEKVLELERKHKFRQRKAALAHRKFDDDERGALADKIERLQREWRSETPGAGTAASGSAGTE